MYSIAPKDPAMPASIVLTAMQPMRRLPLPDAPSVEPGLNPNQPKARMKQPSKDDQQVVARHRKRLAVAHELPDSRSDDHRHRQSGDASDRVDDARTGEVRIAVSQAEVGAEVREPATAPRPVGIKRIREGAHHKRRHDERRVLPAFGRRAGHDGERGIHEHHLEQEQNHDENVISPPVGEKISALPPHAERLAKQGHDKLAAEDRRIAQIQHRRRRRLPE